jgi:hypothetical protein
MRALSVQFGGSCDKLQQVGWADNGSSTKIRSLAPTRVGLPSSAQPTPLKNIPFAVTLNIPFVLSLSKDM